METKWASLLPFARVAALLKDVLPVGDSMNQETIRNHLQGTAERIEHELGEERPFNLFEGVEEEWAQQPLPDGPMTVGIDGGYVRAAHKQGWFEVIAGKSVVAFRRDETAEAPPAKCFGFVQTYDEKPRRRLWELMKSQGLQENQQVVFMSDGGESVRRMHEREKYLTLIRGIAQPCSVSGKAEAKRSAAQALARKHGETACRARGAKLLPCLLSRAEAQGISPCLKGKVFGRKIPIRLGTGQQLATVAQTSIRGLATARTCVVAGLPRT